MSITSMPDVLRSQRKNPAVLKVDLARMRERSPFTLVVVLEGKEDLPVYEAWIKRIADELAWEPIIAHGKGKVLEFRELIRRDKTGIAACTYFIVDHDYDGLRSAANDDDIYVLPAYSIENFLTDVQVFDSFLRTDLHVVGDPSVRAALLDRFESLERSFVNAIVPACAKLYGARNERVGNVVIDEAVGDFIEIDIDRVEARSGVSVDSMIKSDLPVSVEGCTRGVAFFVREDARFWVRGKFILHFYKKICELFYEDRRAIAPLLFSEQARGLSYTPASVDFRSLAAKSALPDGLAERVWAWMGACERNRRDAE